MRKTDWVEQSKKFTRAVEELTPGMVAVIGVPFDAYSSFLRGPATAPVRIRHGLREEPFDYYTETGINLNTLSNWRDLGDLPIPNNENGFQRIEELAGAVVNAGAYLLTIGGDHSISYPILRAHRGKYPGLTILQLDAHPDTYDVFDGNRLSHACPFARIMEEGLADRLVQVGVRTVKPATQVQTERFGIEVIQMQDWDGNTRFSFDGPVYLSLDMDVLDPAFAPGVSHHEAGGMTSREVLNIIHQLEGRLVGADLVEYNPDRDPYRITLALASKLFKEILAHMLGV